MLTSTVNPSGALLARQTLGTADASVTVTTMPKIIVKRGMMGPSMVSYTSEANEQATTRDPAQIDVLPLLPRGSRIVAEPASSTGAAPLKVGDATGSYPVHGLDARSPLTTGTYRLDRGRMPTTSREVGLSPSLADHLGLRKDGSLVDNAAVETADGRRFTVVGLARSPYDPKSRALWALPGSPLAPIPHDADLTYLVDLPAGANPVDLQQRLATHGIALTPRSWVLDPPASPAGGGADTAAWAVTALVIGFGVLEIVLLAGCAFAVGARRQTRELGLVTATGGTPQDVRMIVLAQGMVLGLVGTVAGAVLAVAVAVIGKPGWERLFNHLIDGWSVPIVPLAAIAAVGLVAGLAAAVVPAIIAGRQQPMAALAGRFTVATASSRLRRPALVLLAVGVASVLAGTSMLGAAFDKARRAAAENQNLPQGGITPKMPIALVLIGITAVIAAMVWLLPNLVAKTAGLGKRLPLSGRLALRDAARHRHRVGPATAAIMMSVGGTVAMAFTLTNSFAAEAADYVPTARDGDAVVRFMNIVSGGVTRSVAYSPELVRRLEQHLPARGHTDLSHIETKPVSPGLAHQPTLAISEPTKAGCDDAARGACYYTSLPVVAVDPSYLDQLGAYGSEAAAVLRQGKVALPKKANLAVGSADLIRDGKVRLRSDNAAHSGVLVPAETVDALPRLKGFESAALVSPDTASTLGRLRVFETHFDLTRQPSAQELSAAISVVGAEELLTIEEGYSSRSGTAFIALLSAATIVTVLGVAISVSLAAAEGRADLATLAAVGAHPRRRRGLAAAQAWLLGQLGCLLGVGIGGLYGYTAHVAFGSPYLAIPWRELAAILLAVPLIAGALAWLLTRSQLPMVRRLE